MGYKYKCKKSFEAGINHAIRILDDYGVSWLDWEGFISLNMLEKMKDCLVFDLETRSFDTLDADDFKYEEAE